MSAISHQDHLVNYELLRYARGNMGGFDKVAFIPGGDMTGGGGGGGAPPPGGDPAAMGGGAPPPGGDPAAMGGGGAPPGGDPGMSMGGDPLQQILQKLNQLTMGGGAGGAAGAGALKPKVDVNMVLVQILKILARIADALGVKIPASEMVPGTPDIQQLAQSSQAGTPMPGMDPTAGGGAGGAGDAGAISPVGGMQGMQPAGTPGAEKMGGWHNNGTAFNTQGLIETGNKARAIAMMRRQQRAA
jgi:hypothetical protein